MKRLLYGSPRNVNSQFVVDPNATQMEQYMAKRAETEQILNCVASFMAERVHMVAFGVWFPSADINQSPTTDLAAMIL